LEKLLQILLKLDEQVPRYNSVIDKNTIDLCRYLLEKLLQILLKLDEQVIAAGEAGTMNRRCGRVPHASDTASRCFLYVCAATKKSYSRVKNSFLEGFGVLQYIDVFLFRRPPSSAPSFTILVSA
jgi:hypothetical protein